MTFAIALLAANVAVAEPIVRDHRGSGPVVRDHRTNNGPVIRDHRGGNGGSGGVNVGGGGYKPKPSRPPVKNPPVIVGIPRPPVKNPPVVVGISRPPVKNPPVIVGISRPPVKNPPVIVGISRPPVKNPPIVGIVRPPARPPVIVGIPKPPVKPPVIGIIKPPVKPPIIVGIPKPPVKPPVIGIIKPPVKPPVIVGIIKPPHPKPHWPKPHYPKPHWPHHPHCPPIVVYPPWTVPPVACVTIPVPIEPLPFVAATSEAYDLSCRLPENTNAQDILGVDVVLVRSGTNISVRGTLYASDETKLGVNEDGVGTMDEKLNLSLTDGDQIYLEAAAEPELEGYLYGTIDLLGRTDKKGLLCTLSPHKE